MNHKYQDMDIKSHKHILVCGDNTNSLNILRSLGEKSIRPIVILQQEGHILLLAKSKYIGELIYVKDFDESVAKLLEFANPDVPPFVYITDDNHLQVIDENFNKLNGKFYFFNAGEQGRITHFLSKQEQCMLAEECGLKVPRFEEVERGQLPLKLSYPIFTKTNNSYSEGWKHDVFICNTPEELKSAYETMLSKRLLLQEYVEKIGEYSMQGISINGGESVYMPFERMYLRFTKTSFGGYMYYQPFTDKDLQKKVKMMLQEIGFSGCFEVEFLVDKAHELHFLEINLRFSASNYGVITGGVNLPYLWAKSTLAGKIDTTDIEARSERYYVINEIKDIQAAKEVGFLTWIWQLITADGYYLYNSKDTKPFYHWVMQKAVRKIKRIIGH